MRKRGDHDAPAAADGLADPLGAEPDGYEPELRRLTRRSVGWMFGERVLEQAFSFLLFVLMARVLSKPELGTFAILWVTLDIGREVARGGVYQRIARAKELSAADLDTSFWLGVASAALFCLAMVAFAHFAEDFFQAPLLGPITNWMTIVIMLSALGNTHLALRMRDFGHRTLAARSLAAGVIGLAVAVAGIAAGWGLWAFVVQRIVREAIVTVFAWRSVAWRPGLRFDRNIARGDIAFGKDIVATHIVSYLSLRAQDLLIARAMGPAALSTYRVAWRSAELLGPQIIWVLTMVSLQTFSRLQEKRDAFRLAYRGMLRQCSLLTVPALVGYGVAGPWLVPALFGRQWSDAGALTLPLAALAIPFAITYFFQSALSALGHAAWQRRLAFADMLSTILVGAIAVRFGLMAVVIAYVVRAYFWIPFQIFVLNRVSAIGWREHFWAFWPAVAASAIMAMAVHWAMSTINPNGLLLVLLICGGGALLYGVLILILLPSLRSLLRQGADAVLSWSSVAKRDG